MPQSDSRNVMDEFKGQSHELIIEQLNQRGVSLEVAVENLERDFNMGTIVRNANAFGVRTVHVIGRKQWNKRGAMMTDKYLSVHYHDSVESFVSATRHKQLVAIDITPEAIPLQAAKLPQNAILIFGAEGPGISNQLLGAASQVVCIEQRGSTRSVNVGVAAGIAIYEWTRRYVS